MKQILPIHRMSRGYTTAEKILLKQQKYPSFQVVSIVLGQHPGQSKVIIKINGSQTTISIRQLFERDKRAAIFIQKKINDFKRDKLRQKQSLNK